MKIKVKVTVKRLTLIVKGTRKHYKEIHRKTSPLSGSQCKGKEITTVLVVIKDYESAFDAV